MMSALFWTIVLALSGALLFLAYAGYPLLLMLLRPVGAGPPCSVPPTVSVVLVVKNEANRMPERVRNLFDSGVPLKELIVVCDGCTDATLSLLRQMEHPALRVLEMIESKGKPAGVNVGVQMATAEVVVLCDARQRFNPQTIPHLLRWFGDPQTGAVSGALLIECAGSAGGKGVDTYWKLEKAIRRMESDLDSSVGCTGAVYAIRRRYFRAMPEDTILDDVVVPMQIAEQGLRVRFDPEALAFDPQRLDGSLEQRRKIRTLAGNFQMMARYPHWLLPWGHRLWWKYLLHKCLRLGGPVFLLLAWLAAIKLLPHLIGVLALLGLGVFFGMAVLGLALPQLGSKCFSIPAGFVFLQGCVIRGFYHWLRAAHRGGWR